MARLRIFGRIKAMTPKSPSDAHCFICLDEGPDDDGRPLVRNCACRGDFAGFAHIPCLVNFAKTKSKEKYSSGDGYFPVNAWKECLNCHQLYQGSVRLDLAKACVGLNEQLPETDLSHYESLLNLMHALTSCGDKEASEVLTWRILAIMDRITWKDTRRTESELYWNLTMVTASPDTWDSASVHARHSLELNLEVYGPSSTEVRDTVSSIQSMEVMFSRRNRSMSKEDTALALERAREEYNYNQERYKNQPQDRLNTTIPLVTALENDGKMQEAIRVVEDMQQYAMRALGPDHPDTKGLELKLTGMRRAQSPIVKATIVGEPGKPHRGEIVTVLRAREGGRYSVELPGIRRRKTVKAKAENLRFHAGTPVVLQDMEYPAHYNGASGKIWSFDENEQYYIVRLDQDKDIAITVIHENMQIVFA